MIALLGATGYTGRLVAAELGRRGLPHRLGARDPGRLAQLARPGVETFVVDASSPERLDEFLKGASALITTVGPFNRLGLPVVEAAVRNGVPYVDSTGEMSFMEEVYDRFATAPAPVVPACGFDYMPGDLAVAVAAAAVGGQPETVDVVYRMSGMSPSRGTVRSALGMLGQLTPAATPEMFEVAGPDGPVQALEIPWGEAVTVPRHLPGVKLRVGVAAPRMAAQLARPLMAGMRAVAPWLEPLADRLPEGASPERRARSRFEVVAVVTGGAGRRASVVCEGSDVYGTTALLLVQAALDVRGAGAMTPAQAVDPAAFLDAVSLPGGTFRWRRFGAGGG